MRVQSLTLAAAGLALLAPASPSPVARPAAPDAASGAPTARQEGSVRAADLLARVRDCAPVSRGHYRTDDGVPATVPVCGTREAVFWTADLDIDCDGRPGPICNSRTDPLFSDLTAYTQSDGRYLSAETLPYIVVPGVSDIWNHREDGVRGGSVAAVVYGDRVQYAVVGDVGPQDIIGEASYATAKALGIRADPSGGGTPSGVTYIVFKNTVATPIENHAVAAELGQRLARSFVESPSTRDTRVVEPPVVEDPPRAEEPEVGRDAEAHEGAQEPEADVEPESGTDSEPDSEPDSGAESEPDSGVDSGADSEPDSGVDSGAEEPESIG